MWLSRVPEASQLRNVGGDSSGSDIVVGATGKVITSDGNSGTAQAKDDSPGTFVFTWPSGSVDTLILSQEGNFLDGRSNGGVRVWAVKLK